MGCCDQHLLREKDVILPLAFARYEGRSASAGALHMSPLVGEFLFDALPCAGPEVPAVIVFVALQFLGPLQ